MDQPETAPPPPPDSPEEPPAGAGAPAPRRFAWLSGASLRLGWGVWWPAHLAALPLAVWAAVKLGPLLAAGAVPSPSRPAPRGLALFLGFLVLQALLFRWSARRTAAQAFGVELPAGAPVLFCAVPFFIFVTIPTFFFLFPVLLCAAAAAAGLPPRAGDLPVLGGLFLLFLLGLANATALVSWMVERLGESGPPEAGEGGTKGEGE